MRPKINSATKLIIMVFMMIFNFSLSGFDHTHAEFNRVLTLFVKDGKVNYKELKHNHKELDDYLLRVAGVGAADLANWTREQKLAYWINAYNAYTIKAIVDVYPIKSIKKIDGVWSKARQKAGGAEISLDDIEHKRLRAELKEPRIHFAINCASIGCPKLASEAYQPDKLEAQFKRGIEALLDNRDQFRIDYQKMELHLSKILDWFGEDFKSFSGVTQYGGNNGVVSFIINYLPESKKLFIVNNQLKIKWIDYDWNLNEIP